MPEKLQQDHFKVAAKQKKAEQYLQGRGRISIQNRFLKRWTY
jgi:hypothetical protein